MKHLKRQMKVNYFQKKRQINFYTSSQRLLMKVKQITEKLLYFHRFRINNFFLSKCWIKTKRKMIISEEALVFIVFFDNFNIYI